MDIGRFFKSGALGKPSVFALRVTYAPFTQRLEILKRRHFPSIGNKNDYPRTLATERLTKSIVQLRGDDQGLQAEQRDVRLQSG